MKTSEITSGLVYAQRKTRVWGSAEAALVLDTNLWTMGEKWVTDEPKGHRRAYVIALAQKGSRAGAGSYNSNPVGIPVLTISEYAFQRTGDDKIQETARALLTQAALQLNVENLFGTYEKGSYPKTRVDVAATMANGDKTTVRVVLSLVTPQTILELWEQYLQSAVEERERRVAWEIEKKRAANVARDQALDIADRLNALLGENSNPHQPGHRKDLERKSNGGYEIKPETLMALLELAEAGRQ